MECCKIHRLCKLRQLVEQSVPSVLGWLQQHSPGKTVETGAVVEMHLPQCLLHANAVRENERIGHIRIPTQGSKNHTPSMMTGVSVWELEFKPDS